MRIISPKPVLSTPQTKAGLALAQNLKSVSHMVYLGGREIKLVKAEATQLTTYLNKLDNLSAKGNVVNYLVRCSVSPKPFILDSSDMEQ
jgi:hypothetical protein